MDVQFSDETLEGIEILYVPVFEGTDLHYLEGEHKEYLQDLCAFKGTRGKRSAVRSLPGGLLVEFIGMGKPETLTLPELHKVAGVIERSATYHQTSHIAFLGNTVEGLDMDAERLTAELADILHARSYQFDMYKTKPVHPVDDEEADHKDSFTIKNFAGVVEDPDLALDYYTGFAAQTNSVNWAKDLTNRAPNDLTPAKYAAEIEQKFADVPNVTVNILDKEDLEKQGMGGVLAVGRACEDTHPPYVAVIEYNGTDGTQDKPQMGLVGKGVTFDTGGANVKPGDSMSDMHKDMGGSAAVVGAIHALAAREADVKVVGVVGLVKNAIGPKGYTPMEVITMRNGKTVEVTNTDAEGRLVLADCLTLLQQVYDPDTIHTVATLTGASLVASGPNYTDVFSNSDALWAEIDASGKEVGEKNWRQPYAAADFAAAVQSSRADMVNCALGHPAGASTAAAFVLGFVEKRPDGTMPAVAHHDIAGTATGQDGMASGVKVRELNQLAFSMFENKPEPAPQPELTP